MAIKVVGNPKAIFEDMRKKAEETDKRIIAALKYVGENFVRQCREQPGNHALGFYHDRTGNLRNSIGYILFDGEEVIEESVTGAESNKRELVEGLIDKRGYQLFLVAGMNYASYVEAKGYNVITQQKDVAIIKLDEYMAEIQKFIDK